MMQTSANISSITFNFRAVLMGHVANESHYGYTGYAIAQQNTEVFIKMQSNILIMTLVPVTYSTIIF